MSYDNAEPKPLKFLVSDGKLVDESGNVIAESDTLQDLYIKSSPQVKKYLLSDGSVVDENGNVVNDASDYWKKVYDQAEPKVAKYLHADGTIDENPGSGGADLEDNKEVTIDVSTYTEPVEITPTEGKDGMKKATVTLSNIPSPSGGTLYCWEGFYGEGVGKVYLYSYSANPEVGDGLIVSQGESGLPAQLDIDSWTVNGNSNNEITVKNYDDVYEDSEGEPIIFARYPTGDISLI